MIAAAITLALVSALCYAAAAALEQHQASADPTRRVVHPGLLLQVARRPLWLAGFAVGMVGAGAQAVALAWAPLALVQPIGVTTVVFAIPMGAILRGRRPAVGDLLAAGVVALGLTGLLSSLRVPSGSPTLTDGGLVTLAVTTAAVLGAMMLAAVRLSGTGRALLLAGAAGTAFGVTSALLRVPAHGATTAGMAAFLSWGTLALAVAAAVGLVLEQGAFKTGRLSTALAVITVVDPLVAVGSGAWVLRQPVHVAHPLLAAAEALLVVAGVAVLARRIHAASGPYGARGAHARPWRVPVLAPLPDARRSGGAAERLRILIGTDTYPPDVNGAAYFTRRLARGLAGLGHEVHVVCPATSRASAREADGSVTVHRLPSRRTPFHTTFRVCPPPGAGAAVARVVMEVRPDVIHTQGHFLIGRALCRLASRTGLPLVATNHFMPENLLPYTPVPAWLHGPLAALAWRDFARVVRHARTVTTPTPTAADLVRASGAPQQVLPISCGIDLAGFPAYEGRRSPREIGLPDRATLLFVGRLDAEKRVHDLIDALPLVRECVDAQLVVVGIGGQQAALERRARERGVDGHVRFLGFVPDAALPLVYTTADVFCIPGVAELQSLVTLEAMSTGRPVVAADAMALPHLVHHGRNGYRYPPGDVATLAGQVVAVLSDPARARAMGRAGHAIAAEHDESRTLRRFEDLYRDVITDTVPSKERAAARVAA